MPPVLTANPAAAIPSTLLGIGQTVTSLINSHKAKEEAKALAKSRPKREIYKGYGDNLSLAESELAGGMSEGAKSAYNAVLDREQSGSLSALLRGGGDVNNVADVFASGEDGRQRLAMLTDQLRLRQIDNVIKARDTMGDEVAKNFFWNKTKPWEDSAAANAKAREDANKGIWSGLSTLTGGISTILGGGKNQKTASDSGGGGNLLLNEASHYNFGNFGSNTDQGENTGRPNVFQTPNFNPNTPQQANDFQVPDYMNDPMWWNKI